MLAAAGVLFWAPWDSGGGQQGTQPAGDVVGSTAVVPSTDPAPPAADAAQPGAPSGPSTHVVDGAIVPVRITIPAIGVDTTVEHRGTVRSTNPFTGQVVDAYGVPVSMRTTSWWSDGPKPGSGQMAVVLGHTQVGGYGAFNDLGKLRAGQPFTLRAANGDTLRLQVLGSPVTGLDKATSALADTLAHHPAGAAVALVTCGGAFDEKARQSEDNTVVFASVVH
jgi:hypothetical protein